MTISEDLRFGVRVLAKRPWISALMIVLLAAGIGINTMVVTLVDAVLVRGLPYEESDRVLYLKGFNVERDDDLRTSLPDFLVWRQQTKTFESLAAFQQNPVNLADDEAAPQRANAARVTANAFRVLRVDPIVGRHFTADEVEPGKDQVVILGHALWQDRYGGHEDVIGKSVRIDERARTIVGVMPPDFEFPLDEALWVPLEEIGDDDRDRRRLGVYGRLAVGVTPDEAQTEMSLIGKRLQQQFPDTNEHIEVTVLTFNENFNGGQIESVFLAMLGAVGFVLLIACANVANIQLARAMDRSKEISIRRALGAGRLRIFRQLLVESILLASAGGVLGLVFAWVGIQYFDLATAHLRPYWIDFGFNGMIFAYLAVVCLFAGVLFGLAPAIQAVRRDVNSSLKQGRGQTTGSRVRFFATAMVAGEVAMALILLVGAGLMVESFWNVYTADMGVRTDGVLSAAIELPEAQYDDDVDRHAFFRRVLEDLQSLPGVLAATSASSEPGQGANGTFVEIEGRPAEVLDQRPRERYIMVGQGYFDLLEANVVQGRDFEMRDTADSAPVVIVNRRFAEKYFPGESPIGQRIRGWDSDEEENLWAEVVGVVSDIRTSTAGEFEPVIYRNFDQDPWGFRHLLVRAQRDAAALVPAIRQVVAGLDPNLPVYEVHTVDARLEESRWAQRLSGSVFVLFGLVALAMSASGIYGLVSYSVGRRTSEFGIRMALGAASSDIKRLIVKQGMWRVAIGIAVGLPASYVAGQALASLLVGVSPTEPFVLLGVAAFLIGVAVFACWMPARRASAVSPGTALHHE